MIAFWPRSVIENAQSYNNKTCQVSEYVCICVRDTSFKNVKLEQSQCVYICPKLTTLANAKNVTQVLAIVNYLIKFN